MAAIRVLLEEHQQADAARLRNWLKQDAEASYEVCLAANPSQTAEMISRETFDVVLLDLSVPGSSGVSRVSEARAAQPAVSIIVRGEADPESAAEILSEGAQDYLHKADLTKHGLKRSIRYAVERVRSARALRESEERYKLAIGCANDGIWDWDLRSNATWYAPRWKTILGYGEDEIGDTPKDWFSLVHPEDLHGLATAINRHLEGETAQFQHEHRMQHKEGGWRWMLTRGGALRDESAQAYRMAGSMTDVTARKTAEQRLMRLALYDDLTGLANRTLFVSRLSYVIRRYMRSPVYRFAVLFVDLDRFKLINDSMGHAAGDELLVTAARRLESCVRPTDTVARIGGDEFAVLLDDLDSPEGAEAAAKRIHEALGVPVSVRGQEVFTSASIGIAEGGTGQDGPEELLRKADLAMYRAKRQGRSRSETFENELHDEVVSELSLETDLRKAMDQNEFALHYQPIVALDGGDLVGFEALVRWNSAERGWVSPAEFIPFAEERGLMVELGLQLMRQACEHAARLQGLAGPGSSLVVGINLSGKQFVGCDLVEEFTKILDETGCDPHGIVLELTETALLQNPELVAGMLSRLRELGVRIHLDDFGTGYSSLSYLQRFPIDSLKIDRAFIGGLADRVEDQAIVRAIVGLARSLGKGVVAEGIEDSSQIDRLRLLGCEHGQGYFFSKAVEFDRACQMVGQTILPCVEPAQA